MNTPLKAAQRHYDNELPDLEEPLIEGALHCICGRAPYLDAPLWTDKVFLRCPNLTCRREGPLMWNHDQARDGWNAHVLEWRKE